jgi:hypothetical protein
MEKSKLAAAAILKKSFDNFFLHVSEPLLEF